MSANGNDAYCIEPSRSTPDAGTYPTSEAGDLAAAMWFSYGAPGFDASMWPSSWYDGSGMDEDKYRVASHILLSYANLGSAAEATYGTSAEFASWAEREIAGDVWSQVNARANEVSTGFSAIRIHAGSDAQTLASFTWGARRREDRQGRCASRAQASRATPRSRAPSSPSSTHRG